MTGGIGVDRAIDAVGIDAEHAHHGPAASAGAKAGTLSIIGVYPPTRREFPIGRAMNKNVTVKMGNCHHPKYISHLLDLIASGTIDPVRILTVVEPIRSAIDAYVAFDERRPGWLKVELQPAAEYPDGGTLETLRRKPSPERRPR